MFIKLSRQQLATSALTVPERQAVLAALPTQVAGQMAAISQYTAAVVTAQLSRLTRPFFIAQGGQDELIDPQVAVQLRDQLQAQQLPVSFHWYSDSGHVVTVNTAHHQLEQDVLTYLKTIYK